MGQGKNRVAIVRELTSLKSEATYLPRLVCPFVGVLVDKVPSNLIRSCL